MSISFPQLGITLDYVGSSLRFGSFEIAIYGILIAVGMLLGVAFVVLQAKRRHQNQNMYLGMTVFAIIGGAIGARLYYVAFSWNLFSGKNLMEICDIRNGGMAVYGAVFGGAILASLFCRIAGVSFMEMADTASMGLLIGQIIGIWGNFFNRESFGEYTDTFFAMRLPLSAVRANEVTALMREHMETVEGVSYIQVHPLFLYESAWCLLLLLILLGYNRRKKFQGEIFMRYLAGYGFGKFFIEWLRTDPLYIPGTKISVSLIVSAVLFVVFALMASISRSMAKKREAFRKRRREALYEAEEKEAANYSDEWSGVRDKEAEKQSALEALQELEKELAASKAQETAMAAGQADQEQAGSSEKSDAQPEN